MTLSIIAYKTFVFLLGSSITAVVLGAIPGTYIMVRRLRRAKKLTGKGATANVCNVARIERVRSESILREVMKQAALGFEESDLDIAYHTWWGQRCDLAHKIRLGLENEYRAWGLHKDFVSSLPATYSVRLALFVMQEGLSEDQTNQLICGIAGIGTQVAATKDLERLLLPVSFLDEIFDATQLDPLIDIEAARKRLLTATVLPFGGGPA